MKVEKNTVVSINSHVSEEGGTLLERSDEGIPMAYLHGHENILPALETALEGKAVGEKVLVTLPPVQAYGAVQEGAQAKVPVKHLVGKYKRLLPGMLVKVNTAQGPRDARIIKAGKFMVDIDTNHPFAGKTLEFDVTIKDVRAASAEETAHGHAHGAGGHHH